METMSVESLITGGLMVFIGVCLLTLWSCRDSIVAFFQAPHFDQLRHLLFESWTVNTSARPAYRAPSDYGKPTPERVADGHHFHASHPEAEAEVSAEVMPEASDIMISLPEKTLHERIESARQQGQLETFAKLHKAGYLSEPIKARQLSAMKRLVFGVSAGRALDKLNAALEAVSVPSEELPEEGPRLVAVDNGKRHMEL